MTTLPEVKKQEKVAVKELQGALLNLVDLYVRKEYLNEIEMASVMSLSSRKKMIIPEKNMRLFHVEKLSYALGTKVSDKIKVYNVRLAVIPSGEKQIFCYEVAGSYNGLDYFVYVDAKTAKEVNILRVVDNKQGSMTM